MRHLTLLLFILTAGCGTSPGRLKNLTKHDIPYQRERTVIDVEGSNVKLSVQYTGCGGLYILKGNDGIMIDPFFSNQKIMRITSSLLGGGNLGKCKLASDSSMIAYGIGKIENTTGNLESQVRAIFSAHSHYDHLMDVPAIVKRLRNRPVVYTNQSGYNTCYNVIDRSKMEVLENHMTTQEISRPPIELITEDGKIHVYPIHAEHNPHIKYVKFFSGGNTNPVSHFTSVYEKTRGNDWLEGNTFSFLIDYLDKTDKIEFRIFVQSSSCSPMAGIPPKNLLDHKLVDLAFLGVASYQFSPEYPCTLLSALNSNPRAHPKIIWIHWEDFFRKYTKKPKTVRGTDVVKFFDLPCVKPYKAEAFLPWPGVLFEVR